MSIDFYHKNNELYLHYDFADYEDSCANSRTDAEETFLYPGSGDLPNQEYSPLVERWHTNGFADKKTETVSTGEIRNRDQQRGEWSLHTQTTWKVHGCHTMRSLRPFEREENKASTNQ